LTDAGVVGPVTWDRLMREAQACSSGATSTPAPIIPYPSSPVRIGQSGESVRQIQAAINRLVPQYPNRLWRLTEDGIFGQNTQNAIFTFQSIFGLTTDGVVGPVTWDRLMREAAAVRTVAVSAQDNSQTQYNPLTLFASLLFTRR